MSRYYLFYFLYQFSTHEATDRVGTFADTAFCVGYWLLALIAYLNRTVAIFRRKGKNKVLYIVTL